MTPKLCEKEVRFLYTVLLLIEIYLLVKFQVIPLIVSVLCSGQYIRKFSETSEPTESFHVAPTWDGGKDGKLIQMI